MRLCKLWVVTAVAYSCLVTLASWSSWVGINVQNGSSLAFGKTEIKHEATQARRMDHKFIFKIKICSDIVKKYLTILMFLLVLVLMWTPCMVYYFWNKIFVLKLINNHIVSSETILAQGSTNAFVENTQLV